jgi:hypothetical protein
MISTGQAGFDRLTPRAVEALPLSLLGKAIHQAPLHASDGRMDKNGEACMKMPRDIRDRNQHIATRGRVRHIPGFKGG